MIMTLTKHYDNKNAIGCRIELEPMTEAQIAELRAWLVHDGFREGVRTRKLSNKELSKRIQKDMKS